jgi:NAD-dependent dihydropyrimidine dehydrogenase PreA subunit
MPNVVIEEKGCRDCSLCIDICPTDVLTHDDSREMAVVSKAEDCIGCTSCQYICPSRCIKVTDVSLQRPFFRIENDANLVQRLLQKTPVSSALSEADVQEALKDVSVRLVALADSVTETMGRGQKAVGRKAGLLAASHLPEMYEGGTVPEVLERMRHRFGGAFDFTPTFSGDDIVMAFGKCGIHRIVTQAGGKVGSHVLCSLFHEYWAGLVGTFTGRNFTVEMTEVGATCTMKLSPRG